MKGQGGGGTARGKAQLHLISIILLLLGGGKNKSGGGAVSVSKTKALKSSALGNHVLTLRSALFTSSGQDKDVTEGIAPAFLTYKLKGESGERVCIKLKFKLTQDEENWAFSLCKRHMHKLYEDSGYGWDDSDKRRELNEPGGRYLLLYKLQDEGDASAVASTNPIGYAHFRFTVQGDNI